MYRRTKPFADALTLPAASLIMVGSVLADTTISTFDNFNLNGFFGSWTTATIVSGPTSYSITSTGFGSGFKDMNPNINATGETKIELTVTLSGSTGTNGAVSGPIVSLVDADGTFYNYAWFGQAPGRHVLLANLNAPTSVANAGTVPGLDLSNLTFFHLQDDPGGYTGQYTITFENLRLTGAPRPIITSHFYNPTTAEFTLTWSSFPGRAYSILYSSTPGSGFSPLLTDIPSDGNSTTYTVILPTAEAGFLGIQLQ